MADLTSIERLNVDCTCVTLDVAKLCAALEAVAGDGSFCRELVQSHPNLMSAQSVFLSEIHAERMRSLIAAVETVATYPAYQAAVLSYAPDIAHFRPEAAGVFMGYDFHLGSGGPKLIEINTNAGGGLINAYLTQAQRVCCVEMGIDAHEQLNAVGLPDTFVDCFRTEWHAEKRSSPLRSIAIIDDAPNTQYLYPEFVLFQRLFERHGITALIASPDQLDWRDQGLWLGEQSIDLVYNRFTDFDFSSRQAHAMRKAYLSNEVVVTPNPHAHALFANKRNLSLLSNESILKDWGVPQSLITTLLEGIPRTERVADADPHELWARRGDLFFKPCSGYGGKAAYRGDKVTRKVWNDILSGDYVAQEIVQPSVRSVAINDTVQVLKTDIRNYTYRGNVLLRAARLYQGQTTNFRSPGGGFAPVFVGDVAQACDAAPNEVGYQPSMAKEMSSCSMPDQPSQQYAETSAVISRNTGKVK